ncbi:MAG TPA: sulfatase-like hydrolase/transferase [Vicinamibacterales bacterium]|nr:sulfatase-like hydrolase/transferase [Vicinamibacterales bacterium]
MSLAGCGGGTAPHPAARPNILLITIDTFRADRIATGVAPAIDRLAASGLRFTNARTAVPLTLPSHTTIHTGLLPPQHGVRENGTASLAASHRTIARLLKDAGYRTAAFVGAFVLDRRFGLAQGFDTYDDHIPRDPNASERLEAERPAGAVIDRALEWFDSRRSAEGAKATPSPRPPAPGPFFVWIHLYDPHAPYEPPPDYRGRTKTPYDDEIAYADAEVARLLFRLRPSGVLDRTVIIVAGDHGEGLGDHGERTHGMLLYDSTLRVPLVIVAPGRTPEPVDTAVSLTEIAPTILRAAGVTPPPEMTGRDLLTVRLKPDATAARLKPDTAVVERTATVSGGSVRLQPDRDPDLYSETEYPRVAGWSPLQALTDGRWKVIRAGSATEVYDLQNDAREEHDVAAPQAAIASAMSGRAVAIHAAGSAAQPAIPADAQDRLRALGYVASSAQPPAGTNAVNPRTAIGAWNAFEDALSALNAGRPTAVAPLKALAAAHPDASVFQTTYARALKDAGRPIAALNVYRAAARRWPTDATLIHDLAVAAREAASASAGPLAESLRDEASRADQAAIALDPQSAPALNGLGLLAIEAGRPAEAARSFERAAAIDPNNASYWTNLGNARRASADTADAEHAYRRALEADPEYADAANGLGVLLVEAQRPGAAVPWFERAIAASPSLVEAQLNLGIALQQTGDIARAADAYRRVLSAQGAPQEKEAATKLLAALGARR